MKKLMATLALALGMNCLAATTYDYADGPKTWSYTLKNSEATLTGVTGTSLDGELVIPSEVGDETKYPVVAIAAAKFQSLAITSLKIADSVKTIGAGAFANCAELISVDMGDGVVTIANGEPNRVGNGANTQDPDAYRQSGAFGNCINLEEVSFSSSLITLGAHAFSECLALKAIELPDSLQTIGVNCFYHNTSLASVKFGADLETVGQYSFYNCPELQTVEFKANETPLLTIGVYAFAKGVKLTTLSFSNSLKQLNEGAFFGCTALTGLSLPDSLIYIGNAAFANCTSLKTVDMGDGVVTIANGEPNRVGNGANTQDPDSYRLSGAFGGCINLEEVIFSSRLTLIGSHAFSECHALKSVALPESLLTIGVNCFYRNKDLTSVSFGRRIESIGQYSFYGCPALRYVTFAETTTPLLTIAQGAFANDISLSTVTLSGGLKSVASGAFANDPLLRKLTIPSIVTEIGNGVFSQMGSLKQVTFLGLPPANLANAGLATDVEIRYSKEWEEDWVQIIETCGFTNATSYDPGVKPPDDPVIAGDVKLTVSNIVVHYVTQSVPSGAVIPPTSAGIVNVIAEVNAGNAIAITADWAKQYPGFEELYGDDFGKAVTAQNNKRDGAGNPMFVWQDFVAGTDPTKPEDTFKASVTFDGETGRPIVSWTPELSAAEAAKREYKVYGKVKLNDREWAEVKGNEADFNFFKVSVGMR